MAASTQEIFEAAVRVIQTLPKNGSVQPSHQLMLKFYAYYKQATKGPCDLPRPGFWDVVGKAKWDAWNELGDMPREEAMQNYVDSLKKTFEGVTYEQIVEAMPHTDLVQTFVEKLGNFYELVDIPDGKVNSANEWTKQIPIKSLQAVSAGISKTVPQRKAPSEDEEDEEDSSESSPGSSGDADREVADVTAHALLAQANRHDHSLESVGHEYIASQIKMQSTPHDEDSELNTNDHHFSHNHTVNGNGVVMFEDNGLSSGASISVASKKIALNGGHRSESESDTEEFCDTSDSLLQEASDEVTLLKKMNSEADAMDDTYADQRAEAAASRQRQDPQYLERELSASDVMRRDESSAALYLSPQQLGDRHWSTNSLPGLGAASEVDLVGLVVQGRGGGGEQDAGASHSLASDPGRARGGGSRRQAPGGADSSQPLPGARGRLLAAGGAGAGGQGSAPPPNRSDMSEQIAVALARLQQDMSSVISRLHTLEALQLAQQQQQQPQLGRSRQNSRSSQQGAVSPWWWPFPNFTGRSMFFVLVWPFIVHFIITLIARRNRNRRR